MAKSQCSDKNNINNGLLVLKKGPWTAEEDQKLIDYIQKHGHGKWRLLPKNAGLKRCGKSCRLRWTNYLRPDIKRGKFSLEEEETITHLHSILGNKWSAIAARLPGRTDNEIKNYWNTHIKKKLLRMGIDPVTHAPRLDLLDLSSILGSSLLNSTHLHPSLLGIGSVNPTLINLATAFLSTQLKNSHGISPQDFRDQDHLCNNTTTATDVQNQFEYLFHENQLKTQIQPCTTSSNDSTTTQLLLDENQLINHHHHHHHHHHQPSLNQFSTRQFTDLTCQNSLSWQDNNGEPSYIHPLTSYGGSYHDNYYNSNQHSNGGNLSFVSLLSSPPSSSSNPLDSSCTAVYVNGGNEDDKDSYCSDLLMLDIPSSGLNVNGCM